MANKYRARRLRRVYVPEWLSEEGKNQEWLATEMRTDPANVTRWLGDPSRISLDILSEMADALKLHSVGELFEPPAIAKAKRALFSSVSKIAKQTEPESEPDPDL